MMRKIRSKMKLLSPPPPPPLPEPPENELPPPGRAQAAAAHTSTTRGRIQRAWAQRNARTLPAGFIARHFSTVSALRRRALGNDRHEMRLGAQLDHGGDI